MAQIKNNTPRVILNGIDDQSIVPLVAQPEDLPIHLPLQYVLTPWGPDNDTLMAMDTGDFTRMYGDGAIDPRQSFYNHATALAITVLEQGNSCMFKRIVMDDATKAGLTLLVMLATDDPVASFGTGANLDLDSGVTLNPFIRDSHNIVTPDEMGGLPTNTTATITGGIRVTHKWVSTAALKASNPTIQLEHKITYGGKPAYPIISIEAPFVGALGDNFGIRLWTGHQDVLGAADPDIVDKEQALVFNAQLTYREPGSTAIIKPGLLGQMYIDFCFKPGAYDYKNETDLTIQDLVDKFSDDGTSTGSSPTYGPLGSVVTYDANITTILGYLKRAEELQIDPLTSDPVVVSSIWLLDFLTGRNFDSVHNFGFQINTGNYEDVLAYDTDILREGFTYYMRGGSDGTMTNANYEAAVIQEILFNFDGGITPEMVLTDSAKYPFSVIYDSGFSMDCKYALIKWMNYRKDVNVAIGTHVYGEAQLTLDEEISRGNALRARGLLYAESVLWGTPACRMVIMMQSGLLINKRLRLPVSTIFDLAHKRAGFMGAGIGKMKPGLGYDIAPANQITFMKKLTNTSLNEYMQNAAWAVGLNAARCFDRTSFFYPALQTIYPINNSILTGEMLMQICCDVERQSQIVWRLLTGRSDLTEAQFVKKSNELMLERVNGRYDNRVIIVPNTYFTPADTARGYSWVMDVSVYGNVPKTVAQVNVITKRIVSQG